MESKIWEANIWGIIGTITGTLSLVISWFTFRYNTPNIEIEEMQLLVPDDFVENWKSKSESELKNSFLDYELEIVVRNRRGGSGSIDKPKLIIKIPDGKKYLLLNKYKEIISSPQTEHIESQKESENITSVWTVRHGRAFNLSGGEKTDEKLEYEIDKEDMIYSIIQNFDQIKYYIEYRDNYGRRHKKQILYFVKESEVEN